MLMDNSCPEQQKQGDCGIQEHTMPIENHAALLVIDVQNDFCEGGALAVPGGSETVPVINRLLPLFETSVLTQDWHPADHTSFASNHDGKAAFELIELPYGQQVLWPPHCLQGSAGAEFHRDLDMDRSHLIVRKGFRALIDSYSAFFENDRRTPTGLEGYLRSRGVDRVVCTGLATDFCVLYSALDARRLGFPTVVIEDACRAIDLDGSLAAAMSEMKAAGVQIAGSGDFG